MSDQPTDSAKASASGRERADAATHCSRGRCVGRAGRSSGNGCGRRWPRSPPRSGCSWRCPGSGCGCGCRRSAAPSGWACSSCSRRRRSRRCSWCAFRPHRTACAGSTATAACRTGRPPPSPTRSQRRPRITFATALWRAHVERALGAAKALKAGVPAPHVAARDPFALRALVLVLVVATFFRRRQRPPAAHRGGVRLAGRDGAGQFPHRCLGDPAALYRQAAGDPAGPAARRAGAARHDRDVGAGRQHAGRPRDRPGQARRSHERRPRRAEVAMPAASAPNGTEERRFTINDGRLRDSARRRFDAT